MAKYNFDVSGSQLIISLVPVLDDDKYESNKR